MIRQFFLAVILLSSLLASGQDGKYTMGASNNALAGASVTLSNSWSMFSNVGAIGRVDEAAVAAGYQNRYSIGGFQTITATTLYSFDLATAGFSYYRFGDELYNQQKLGFAIGNKIQMVSLGMGANMIQYQIEGLGVRRKLAIEFGGVAEIIPQLALGAHIFNFDESQMVPTVMKAGLSYRPGEQIMFNIETEKEIGFKEVFKAGIQYQLIPSLYFRTGISTHPFRSAFGLGLVIKKLDFDYCYSNDSNLGSIHELSLACKLKKK